MFTQSEYLTILTHAHADTVKDFADSLLPDLGRVYVLKNRTGLVMLPYTDSAQGTIFHLGEVLVSEAHLRLENGAEGYGMVTGRDLVQALAVALLDAALTAALFIEQINAFIMAQAKQQHLEDDQLLRMVETTRVEMETF